MRETMDPRVQEILDQATDLQRRYVKTRLLEPSPAAAARKLKIHRSTPHHWDNFDDLELAVELMYADVIETTKTALEDLSLKAVKALGGVLDHGNDAAMVSAAKAIWDRIGLPAMSAVDVTSGGEPVKAVVYIPDNGRD